MRKTHHGLRERAMARLASWLNYLPVICYRTKRLTLSASVSSSVIGNDHTYFLDLCARTQNLTQSRVLINGNPVLRATIIVPRMPTSDHLMSSREIKNV